MWVLSNRIDAIAMSWEGAERGSGEQGKVCLWWGTSFTGRGERQVRRVSKIVGGERFERDGSDVKDWFIFQILDTKWLLATWNDFISKDKFWHPNCYFKPTKSFDLVHVVHSYETFPKIVSVFGLVSLHSQPRAPAERTVCPLHTCYKSFWRH